MLQVVVGVLVALQQADPVESQDTRLLLLAMALTVFAKVRPRFPPDCAAANVSLAYLFRSEEQLSSADSVGFVYVAHDASVKGYIPSPRGTMVPPH